MAAGLAACGGSTPSGPPAYASVTARLPASSPYAVVVAPLELTQATLDREVGRLAEDPGFGAIFRSRLAALLGIDIFDDSAVADTGLDLRGDFALFGLGLRPAFVVRVADEQAFARFLERVRTSNDALVFGSRVVEDRTVETIELGTARVSYTIDDEGWLVGSYHSGDEDVDALFEQVFAVSEGDAPALGYSDSFEAMVRGLGTAPRSDGWAAVLAVDLEHLDGALLAAADPERDPVLAELAAGPRERHIEAARERLERCAARGRAATAAVPWLAGGLAVDAVGSSQRLVLPTSLELGTDVRAVMPGVDDARFDAMGRDAIAIGAASLDFAALAALDVDDVSLIGCPNLAVLEGLLAVLSTRFGATNAADVLGTSVEAVVYGFDMSPFFSERSAALVIGARDVASTLDGVDLWLRGIGMSEMGEEPDGSRSYLSQSGFLGFSAVPLDSDVAVVVGAIDRERLTADVSLGTPSDADEEAGAAEPEETETPAGLTLVRAEIDGAALQASVQTTVDQLSLTGVESETASAVSEAIAGLDRVSWVVALLRDRVVMDVSLDWTP